jgi:hypothetical protein
MARHEWRCPKCGREIVLYVRTGYPPVCNNSDKHSSTSVAMERVDSEHARRI